MGIKDWAQLWAGNWSHATRRGTFSELRRTLRTQVHVRVKQGRAVLKPCCSGIIVIRALSTPYVGFASLINIHQLYIMQTVTAFILMDTDLHVH